MSCFLTAKKRWRSAHAGRRFFFKALALREFAKNDSGAVALEYMLLVALAAILVLSLVSAFGQSAIDLFSSIIAAI